MGLLLMPTPTLLLRPITDNLGLLLLHTPTLLMWPIRDYLGTTCSSGIGALELPAVMPRDLKSSMYK